MTKDRTEYFKKYREENREILLQKARENSKKRYAANREKILQKAKEYYQENKEYYKEKNKSYDRKSFDLSTPERRKKVILRSAKSRAKEKDIPFTITIDDITLVDTCPLLGIELDYNRPTGYHPNQPSLDKIKPELGYVPGNVWVISRKANTMKNDATAEELKVFCENTLKLLC